MIIKILIGIVIYFILLIGICIFFKGATKVEKRIPRKKRKREDIGENTKKLIKKHNNILECLIAVYTF